MFRSSKTIYATAEMAKLLPENQAGRIAGEEISGHINSNVSAISTTLDTSDKKLLEAWNNVLPKADEEILIGYWVPQSKLLSGWVNATHASSTIKKIFVRAPMVEKDANNVPMLVDKDISLAGDSQSIVGGSDFQFMNMAAITFSGASNSYLPIYAKLATDIVAGDIFHFQLIFASLTK